MITEPRRAVLQEALNQRVAQGRMGIEECDRLSSVVWGSDDEETFYGLWNVLATDTHPMSVPGENLPGSPVLAGEPVRLHRSGVWTVPGYERFACTNTTITLDLTAAQWAYPTMTFDFGCTACSITIVAPRGMTVTANFRYRNCDLQFPSREQRGPSRAAANRNAGGDGCAGDISVTGKEGMRNRPQPMASYLKTDSNPAWAHLAPPEGPRA